MVAMQDSRYGTGTGISGRKEKVAKMFMNRRKIAFYTMLLGIFFVVSVQVVFGGEDPTTATRPRIVTKATKARTIPSGQQATLKGNVTKVGQDSFSVCDLEGAETVVQITGKTDIDTHRRGILRSAKSHPKSSLLVGIPVTVKGRGNEAGELVARSVKFHDSAYRATTAVDTRAIPLEKNQEKLADQLEETSIVAASAVRDAKTAQDGAGNAQLSANQAQTTADAAKNEAGQAYQSALSANQRLALLDDFETTEELVVNFKAGSADLTIEAKSKLDEFVAKTAGAKGYAIEISAFASEEGSRAFNHRLSQARTEAVVDYLIGAGKVAPRRIINPYSGGENAPVADNKTREGRMQNRRAEVKMLISKGLAAKEPVTVSNK
jgi:outer membrane protein OmpA-like peptidoglycan-associated protein